MFVNISSNIYILKTLNSMEISLVVVLTPSGIPCTCRLIGDAHVDNREKSCSSLLTMIMDDLCFHNIVLLVFHIKYSTKIISSFGFWNFRIHIYIFSKTAYPIGMLS